MNSPIQPPFEIHVTGVTRVTTVAKHPNSLAFTSVTRLSNYPYTSCDAARTCNAQLILNSLLADARHVWSQSGSRWLRLQNIGRGIERHTLRAIGDD